jgi:manganese/zinc/iron transport system substrate-binding protein
MRTVLGILAIVLSSLSAASAMAQERLSVVVTTGMIADVAKNVGGDLVDVQALMGPGVDPHAYRQTRSDIVTLTRADLVLWHGLYLEAQMEDFLENLSRRTPVVAVADAVPSDLLIADEDYTDRFDPHIWMDPTLWETVVVTIRDTLIEQMPEHKDVFHENADLYSGQLAQLQAYSQTATSSVEPASRVLLTAHDAFGYFGRAYGFDVLGIQGISTESEAGLNRIGELVDLMVNRDIRAVFVESSVSDRNIRALIEGAAAQGHEVVIGGELFSDAMGLPDTYEGTYVGMMDHNITTIVSALGGKVSERGLNGKLSAGY